MTGNTPAVEYVWASSPQGTGTYNFDRLQRIYYPVRPETGRREVVLHYGNDTDDADSRLNRVTGIWDTAIHPSEAVAAYAYMGTSRRVSLTLGNVITQTILDTGQATGLDRYGRITNLEFKNSSQDTVHQYQYAYDISGNRTQARVIQAPTGVAPNQTTHDNDRSYLYSYDHLQRLINAHMGRIGLDEEENLIIVPDDPDVALRRELKWSLDPLGNWMGTPFPENPQYPPPGLRRKDYLDGSETPSTSTSIKHTTDAFNKITAIKTNTVTQPTLNDPAGNLIYDGQYVYQYDAWNRLVEVNLVGSLVYDPANPATDDFDDDGKIHPSTDPVHQIGDLVVRFQYDGLGRLMVAEKVHSGSPPNPSFTKEHYYYDGVRRLQEVVQTPGTPADTFSTQHEYVYGPDYVDEFVAEIQKSGETLQAFYILQDANYNVMALLEADGDVVEQYQWEPYGLLATKDELSSPAPDNKIGHQGLFFYRFDNGSGGTLSVGAVGLYHNRNRWYSPSLGRFTSRDPNGTSSLIQSAVAMSGQALGARASTFDPRAHFADGMNLCVYIGSNPLAGQDPLGLEWNHMYPCYLGGQTHGPGVELEFDEHRRIFHTSVSMECGGGTYESMRIQWKSFTNEQRFGILVRAHAAAGVDVSDGVFLAELRDALGWADANKTHGVPQAWGTPRHVSCGKLKTAATTAFLDRIPGLNKLRAVAGGVALASGVLHGLAMADSLSITNPFMRDLALSTQRAKACGNLSVIDEVTALESFYQLTNDPFVAAYAWEYWRDGLNE